MLMMLMSTMTPTRTILFTTKIVRDVVRYLPLSTTSTSFSVESRRARDKQQGEIHIGRKKHAS